jgi:hypothetical protein
MSIIADELEEYRRMHHPQCPSVPAYLSADKKDWWVECPYCGLHHQHSGGKLLRSSAGLRSPHCPPGVHRPHDYFLVPFGDVTDVTTAKWARLDRKRLPKLAREVERKRIAERIEREARL